MFSVAILFCVVTIATTSATATEPKCADVSTWKKWSEKFTIGHAAHDAAWRNIIFDGNELRSNLERTLKKTTKLKQAISDDDEELLAHLGNVGSLKTKTTEELSCLEEIFKLLPRVEEKSLGARWEKMFAPAESVAMALAMREGLSADEGITFGISNTIADLESVSKTHERLKKVHKKLLDAKDEEKCMDRVMDLIDALADVTHARRPLFDHVVEDGLSELQMRCAAEL